MSFLNPLGLGARGAGDGGLHRIDDADPATVAAQARRLTLTAHSLDQMSAQLRNAQAALTLLKSGAIGTMQGQILSAQGAAHRLSPIFLKAGLALTAFATMLGTSKRICNGSYEAWQNINKERNDLIDELHRSVSVKLPLLPIEIQAHDPRFWQKRDKEQALQSQIDDYEVQLDALRARNVQQYHAFRAAARATAAAFGNMPRDIRDGRRGTIRGLFVRGLKYEIQQASTYNENVNDNRALDWIEYVTGLSPDKRISRLAPLARMGLNYSSAVVAAGGTKILVQMGEADDADVWAAARPATVSLAGQATSFGVGEAISASGNRPLQVSEVVLKPREIIKGKPITATGIAQKGAETAVDRILPPAQAAHTFTNPLPVKAPATSPVGRPLVPVGADLVPVKITVGNIPVSVRPGGVVTPLVKGH